MSNTEAFQKFEVELAGKIISVEVRTNNRRRNRIGLAFDPRGTVCIDAPDRMTTDEVQSILTDHARWIRYRAKEAAENTPCWYPDRYENGAILYYLGQPYVLKVLIGSETSISLRDQEMMLSLRSEDDPKVAIWRFYSQKADVVLLDSLRRCVESSPFVEKEPAWRHLYMKSRWGSCSASGRLSLNSHLVKVPESLTDYVVHHELCHLTEMNHGPLFKKLMNRVVPHWREQRKSLQHYLGLLAETV